MNHSKAPWSVRPCKDWPEHLFIVDSDGNFIASTRRMRVSQAWEQQLLEEDNANAQLIALAPDMRDEIGKTLNVWQLVLEGLAWLKDNHNNPPEGHTVDQWIENIATGIKPRLIEANRLFYPYLKNEKQADKI